MSRHEVPAWLAWVAVAFFYGLIACLTIAIIQAY